MDLEPKKLETMDDLRAAMNDPEIQAANKEFSKKYLKANRPKSLAVVILSVIAIFLLISLSPHKASSVTPTSLRTAEVVEVTASGQSEAAPLSAQQREDLIALLSQLQVKRDEKNADEFLSAEHLRFTFANNEPDDWFAIDRAGYLYKVNQCYALSGMEADAIWAQLQAICGSD